MNIFKKQGVEEKISKIFSEYQDHSSKLKKSILCSIRFRTVDRPGIFKEIHSQLSGVTLEAT